MSRVRKFILGLSASMLLSIVGFAFAVTGIVEGIAAILLGLQFTIVLMGFEALILLVEIRNK